jgi:acetyltransferase-like isoleucine patch superfamily enzyme
MNHSKRNTAPTAIVGVGTGIGVDTVIWHYAIIHNDAVVGDSCSIGCGAEVGKGSVVGNRSRIGAHVFLPANSIIGNDVFIGPGVVATDDKYPRVNNPKYNAEPPTIEDRASVGAGAVLLPGVRIGAGAMIAAGAIVTSDVPPNGCVKCEPARAFERTF